MTRSAPTLAAVGEFGLLARLLPSLADGPGVVVGPGDDCAVLAGFRGHVLFTIDALVDGIHFRRDWLSARQVGRKALLAATSDVSAMGGVPRWCVLHIAAPGQTPARDVTAITQGVAAAAAEAGAALVGGNLSRATELSVTVAVIGEARTAPLTRSGARPGDLLYVTGTLGESALAVRHLRAGTAPPRRARQRYREPPLRVAIGRALAGARLASAAIDVSDGLLQDLGHLCRASGVSAEVALADVPCSPAVQRADRLLALTGGEDYELLCAVPARHRRRVERLAARLGCPMTCIGVCGPAARSPVRVTGLDGRPLRVRLGGHDHFARGGP